MYYSCPDYNNLLAQISSQIGPKERKFRFLLYQEYNVYCIFTSKIKSYALWFVHEKMKLNLSSSLKSCDLVSQTLRLSPLKCHIDSLFSSSRSPTVALFLDICCVSAAFAFCFLAYLLTILQQPCLPSPLSLHKETCDFVSFLRQNGIERISIELASIEKKEMGWSMLKYLLSLFSMDLMDTSRQG